jgi:membrane protein DedA with SNARE-associated domain
MLESLAQWLVETIGRYGYPGIIFLMAVESSAIPFPSEVVMPPAGYLAYKGQMNLWLALGSGILGSLIGAYANYIVARKVGRWFFVRYGKWLLLSEKSLLKAERYFANHGEITTFVGRLLPAIRQLISIPAGLARMRLDRFFFYTGLGAGLWCAVLVAIGWLIGSTGADRASAELIERYSHRALYVILPLLVALIVGYVIWWRRRRRLNAAVGGQAAEPVGEG